MSGDALPKALVPVAGTPVAARLLDLLRRNGVRQVGVMAGHLAEALAEGLAPWGEKTGVALTFFVEPRELGTAGGLPVARAFVGDEDFFVIYADLVAEVDLVRLAGWHRNSGAALTVVCHPNDHPATSDLIDVDENDRVRRVLPKASRTPGEYANLVPAAIYCVSARAFGFIAPGTKQDFVADVFPRLAAASELGAYRTPEYIRDMGSEARFALAERDIASGLVERLRFGTRRPAVFFDRDGVLNEEVGGLGLSRREHFTPILSAGDAVRMVNDAGWLAVVTTNQPQIARGFLEREELAAVHAKLETWLGVKGAHLDRIYHCPHHPDKGFEGEIPDLKVDCDCRKPRPGMILRAARELPIDLGGSCVIGDSWRDVGAARAAGVWAYGVRTGVGCRDCGTKWRPDAVFEDVAEAVAFLRYGLPAAEPFADRVQALVVPGDCITVIGVCGPSRAGKSVFAHGLIRALRQRQLGALHVCLDDWIVPRGQRGPGMTSEERCRPGLYPELLRRLLDGQVVSVAAYEPWSRETGPPVSYGIGKARIIVLDGLWACHESLRQSLDLAVWVETAEELLTRRLRSFHRWKGDDEVAVEMRSQGQFIEEFEDVAVQRKSADWVYTAPVWGAGA